MNSFRSGDFGLLLLRIVVGIIFIMHGQQKWGLWDVSNGPMTGGLTTLLKVLSIVEPIMGIAIILGVLANWAALILALDMIGATYMKITMFHTAFIGEKTTGWEFDITLFAANIVLFTIGSGMISLDRLWKKSA